MKFGFNIPTRGPLAKPADMKAIAQAAERLGFAFVTVNDHVVVPQKVDSTYPYSATGEWGGAKLGEAMETLSVLSFLAGITEKVRLLTSVMVVPHRNPVVTAKALATIDVLSNGRVTVGCGAGWMREEFEALGCPPFEERGRVVNEYLEIFKAIWTEDVPEYKGRYSSFSNVATLPHPVQDPHPPLWIGGESQPAIRRAVSHGDGWYPYATNPARLFDTPARYKKGLESLKQEADKAGRDPATIDLALAVHHISIDKEKQTDGGERQALTGSAATVLEDLAAYAELGVTNLSVNQPARTLDEATDRMERFAAEIMSKTPG